jgi:glycosyltransferase involved in cell wall biosynthesis
VFVFLDTMPRRQGSGASLRYYSNVRAYLDLGFAVEVIHIATAPDGSEPSEDLRPVTWTRVIEPVSSSSLSGRLLFRLGIPRSSSLAYRLPQSLLARREVNIRRRQVPAAFYHFEGEWLSAVIPSLPKTTRAIWSLHDLPSTVVEATMRIACEAQQRGPTVPERRELRFMQRLERVVARHAPLILCIAQHDRDRLSSDWDCSRVEYLPMSIPDDGAERTGRGWLAGGRLRLLHLGRIGHLPSYRSLEFLFEQVFPRLPPDVLEKISMDIVGHVEPDNERARRILALATPYPNVSFRGFVADVIPYYQNADVQVVGSTDASGLRTRTIESFAYGLPVLSTSVGARGIAGLKAGEQILIADDAGAFAHHLAVLMRDSTTLARLSRNGRAFYLEHQSQRAVARALACYLGEYFGVEPAIQP